MGYTGTTFAFSTYNFLPSLFFWLGLFTIFIALVCLKVYLFSLIYKINKEKRGEAIRLTAGINVLLGSLFSITIIPFWISHQASASYFCLFNGLTGIFYLFLLTFFEFILLKKVVLENKKNKKVFWSLFLLNLFFGGGLFLLLLFFQYAF